MRSQFKTAYIHSMSLPNNEANAFDAVWTAASLSEKNDVTFLLCYKFYGYSPTDAQK